MNFAKTKRLIADIQILAVTLMDSNELKSSHIIMCMIQKVSDGVRKEIQNKNGHTGDRGKTVHERLAA